MSEVIHRELVGPLEETAFLMFWEYPNCSFFYYLDKGPEYFVGRVFADNVSVFKLRAGYRGDVAVTAVNGRLEFSFREFVPGLGCSCCGDEEGEEPKARKTDIPKPGEGEEPNEDALKAARDAIQEMKAAIGPSLPPPGPGVCTADGCGTLSPCPPTTPVLICPPGQDPRCVPF